MLIEQRGSLSLYCDSPLSLHLQFVQHLFIPLGFCNGTCTKYMKDFKAKCSVEYPFSSIHRATEVTWWLFNKVLEIYFLDCGHKILTMWLLLDFKMSETPL